MKTKILVVYATTHGHTAKVARRLAKSMRAEGAEVVLREVGSEPVGDPASFDVVVVGGSLHAGRHQHQLVSWVENNRAALDGRPNAFFSVSLTASEDSEEARTACDACIEDFIEDTGWRPQRCDAIAGALLYREYNPFVRTLMRLMMKHGGHETDASRDYDYTDWAGVDRLGGEVARLPSQLAAGAK